MLIEDALRPLSGPVGRWLRRRYYRYRLAGCGANLIVDAGVSIQQPEYVTLGDNVWIDRDVIIVAGPAGSSSQTHVVDNPNCRCGCGELWIGSGVHLGVRTIIQAHAGVTIESGFTSSANVAIYSLSHDPYLCHSGTFSGSGTSSCYISRPIAIGQNVWLGLNVAVFGGTIGNDCFVKPFSVVLRDIAPNSVAAGTPALRIHSRF